MIPLDAVALIVVLALLPILSLLILSTWVAHTIGKRRALIPPDKRTWAESTWLLRPAILCLALYSACVAYGMGIETSWVQRTSLEIKVDRPILGHDRFRIVHLSDLHLDRIGAREQRVSEIVREARPHLVILTGDYMNSRAGGESLVELLGGFRPVYGVYGVGGHWDTKFVTRELFKAARAEFLEDETRLIEKTGRPLRLVGHAVYPQRPLRELLKDLKDDAYVVYLQHSPDAVDELRRRDPDQRVDLFLCGHTHGGQICLPVWGAVVTHSKYHKKYERGLYHVDGGVPMYVNRGVGVEGGAQPPFRFFAPPEVAVIDLVYR